MFQAEKARGTRIEQTYGITLPEYWELYDKQNGACAICKRTPRKHLEVDHDHALENAGAPPRNTVRGLLCRLCNGSLLPAAMDNPEVLTAAADYIMNPPAHQLIQNPK